MNKGVGLIIVGLVLGTAVYVVTSISRDKKNTESHTKDNTVKEYKKQKEERKFDANNTISRNENTPEYINDIEIIRNSVAQTVVNRHNEATEIVSECVDNIYKNCEIDETIDSDLDIIDDELNKILNEV